MAFEVTCKDELSQLLDDSRLNKRHDIWLWLYLHCYTNLNLDANTCNGTTMRAVIAQNLSLHSELIELINPQKDQFLVSDEHLKWIIRDERQNHWLYTKINDLTDKKFPNGLVHLFGPSRLIAMLDIWKVNMAKKIRSIEHLRDDWLRHSAGDRELEWFADKKDGPERCICAWDWLLKNDPISTSRRPPISNHKELLMFFDRAEFSRNEQRAIIDKIKGRWSRKQLDVRNPDKKQVNVMLSKTVITQLDELAKRHNMKRAQVLENLVRMEAENGVYFAEKKPVEVVTTSSRSNKADPRTGSL